MDWKSLNFTQKNIILVLCALAIFYACNNTNDFNSSKNISIIKEKSFFKSIKNQTIDSKTKNNFEDSLNKLQSNNKDFNKIDSILLNSNNLCVIRISNILKHIGNEPIFYNFKNLNTIKYIDSIGITFLCNHFITVNKEKQQDRIIEMIQQGNYCCPYWLFPRKTTIYISNSFHAEKLVENFIGDDCINEHDKINTFCSALYKSGLFVFSHGKTVIIYEVNTCKPKLFSQFQRAIKLIKPDIGFGVECGGQKRNWIK